MKPPTFNNMLLLLSVAFALAEALNLEQLEGDDAPIAITSVSGEFSVALSASICRYCICDVHAASVTCSSERHMQLKVVSLPAWADTFRAHNLTLPELPRFAHHARLRHLRLNFCALQRVDSVSLVPLPGLETLDLADNSLSVLPLGFLSRATHLRRLDLARNQFADIAKVELHGVPSLDELALGGNPFVESSNALVRLDWPNIRQLRLDNANVRLLNATHIGFRSVNSNSSRLQDAILRLPTDFLRSLETLDLSDNTELHLSSDVMPTLKNISLLAVRRVGSLPNALLDWLMKPDTRLHRLDLNGARFNTSIRAWQNFCGSQLAWLDITAMGLEDLELGSACGVQWLYADDNRLTRVKIALRPNGLAPLRTLHLDGNRLTHWPLDVEKRLTHNTENAPRKNFYEVIQSSHAFISARVKRRARRHPNLWRQSISARNNKNYEFDGLEILSLADNLIEGAISCSQFGAMPSLTHLNLAGNRIASICREYDYNSLAFDLGSLSTIEAIDSSEHASGSAPIGAKILYLNVSGNLLRVLSTMPRLDELAVLDASDNSIAALDLCVLLHRMPKLQHLRLARNRGMMLSASCEPRVGAHLVDIELADCELQDQPDFSTLTGLSAVGLAGNQLRAINAARLPPCTLVLDVGENRVERVANFNDTQLACLRRLRLARNPLRCGCAAQRYANVLRQEDEFYDRTEYYCFTSDGWQHPLSAFLDADAQRCANGEAETDEWAGSAQLQARRTFVFPLARLVHFLCAAVVLVAAVTAMARFARFVSAYARDLSTDYKPLARFEAPVSL